MIALIALGANLGDRAASLERALRKLRATDGIGRVACSHVYETKPWGVLDQPPFLNAVVEVATSLDAPALAARLWEIEAEMGRTRGAERNGPRVIDLDLLDAGGCVLDTPDLVLPHPRIAERAFVLVPLVELLPRWTHPRLGRTAADLLASLDPDPAAVRLAGRLVPWEEPRGTAGSDVSRH